MNASFVMYVIVTILIGIIIIWLLTKSIGGVSTREHHRLFRLFYVSYTAIVLFGAGAWLTEKAKNEHENIFEFINEFKGPILSYDFLKTGLVGLIYGFVFGLIDNIGLWFGMDALDPIIAGGVLTKAGLGNTYSNTLGAILATFSGKIMSNLIGIKDTPLWANALGTSVGCLTGVGICRTITNRK